MKQKLWLVNVGQTNKGKQFPWGSGEQTLIVVWLCGLSPALTQDLGALVRGVFTQPRRKGTIGVLEDWIEEHGGERNWWVSIYATVAKSRKQAEWNSRPEALADAKEWLTYAEESERKWQELERERGGDGPPPAA